LHAKNRIRQQDIRENLTERDANLIGLDFRASSSTSSAIATSSTTTETLQALFQVRGALKAFAHVSGRGFRHFDCGSRRHLTYVSLAYLNSVGFAFADVSFTFVVPVKDNTAQQ
jgi:hypothetical protein